MRRAGETGRCLRDERGVALVMAMLTLLILSVLVIGFASLSSTEPAIASNHLRVAQARALAEAGLERAIWALSAGKAARLADDDAEPPSGSIRYPLALGAMANSPYNGSVFLSLAAAGNTIGGFRLRVEQTNPADPHEVSIAASGWAPADNQARQRIVATVMDFPDLSQMRCAVCVRGDIQVGGTSTIDARQDTSCGRKYGTWSTTVCPPGATSHSGSCQDAYGNTVTPISPGNTTLGSGSPRVYGARDENNTPNQSTDMARFQDSGDFDKNKLTDSSLDVLRAYAKSHGTYYRGTAAAPTITFSSTNRLPDCPPNGCVVFVDTISGTNINLGTTAPSDFASVVISGAASVNPAGFKGWIVVNGGLSITGSFTMQGLIYAVNDISYVGTGGQIRGQMISANILDTIATVIDTSLSGAASLQYNCAATKDPIASVISPGFIVKAGTYKEVSD
jgi:hypothetical protein